jgi:hypothetical protein
MTIVPIDARTPTDAIESARAFVNSPEILESMPLAVHLSEAMAEVIRLRYQLGGTLGGKFKCKRVTLCGSARYARAYREWTTRLMIEESAMVHTAPLIPDLTRDDKERIDQIWFAQIAGSDEVFVLDVDKYIGESTAEEIAFAEERGIPVKFLSVVAPGWTEADCRYAPDMVDAPAGA